MNRGVFFYIMIPLILAAGLFQSTAAARIEVRGVKPDLVLLLLIAGTLIYGSRYGLVWAFLGGLALDVFSGGPMGASSLALMVAVLLAGIGHRTLSRYNMLVPLGVTAVGTAIYGFVYLGILFALDVLVINIWEVPLVATVQHIILPATVYNMLLMLLMIPLINRYPESQEIKS